MRFILLLLLFSSCARDEHSQILIAIDAYDDILNCSVYMRPLKVTYADSTYYRPIDEVDFFKGDYKPYLTKETGALSVSISMESDSARVFVSCDYPRGESLITSEANVMEYQLKRSTFKWYVSKSYSLN